MIENKADKLMKIFLELLNPILKRETEIIWMRNQTSELINLSLKIIPLLLPVNDGAFIEGQGMLRYVFILSYILVIKIYMASTHQFFK